MPPFFFVFCQRCPSLHSRRQYLHCETRLNCQAVPCVSAPFLLFHLHQSDGHEIPLVHCVLTPLSFVSSSCPFRSVFSQTQPLLSHSPFLVPSRMIVRVHNHVQDICIPSPDSAPPHAGTSHPGTAIPHLVFCHKPNHILSAIIRQRKGSFIFFEMNLAALAVLEEWTLRVSSFTFAFCTRSSKLSCDLPQLSQTLVGCMWYGINKVPLCRLPSRATWSV